MLSFVESTYASVLGADTMPSSSNSGATPDEQCLLYGC